MANEFGDELRRLRLKAGMTQEELAERSGVSVRTIRGLETGTRSNPRMSTVEQLADALELGPKDREGLMIAAGLLDPGQPVPPAPHTELAEQLAGLVAARWQREEEQRQVQDPFPLPVRWRTASETLTDHWDIILRRRAGDTTRADPLDLTGRLDQIAETFRRIPSGRLVVLGKAGSGKTILTLRFVLDYLTPRDPADPVPVIFSIGAWNPTEITLRDWLTDQLTRDHPGYAAPGPGGESLATALVESGRVLPVLDGFDEMADGLRRPALEALNAFPHPLLLTSRPDEYAAAVAETDVLTAAAAIELTDLTLDDLAAYLPLTTRKTNPANPDEGAWDPVLKALREQPADGAASPLATVLTTPLMVSLTRTVYSDTPDHDPADLLDTERFGTPEELEDHLLDNFLPTVYRHSPQHGSRDCDPDRARRWLGYLADHLTRQQTPDLAWWRLGNGLRPATRTLVTAVSTGLVMGLVDCVVGFAIGLPFPVPFLDATAVGLLSGLVIGIAYWFMTVVKNMPIMPSAMRLRIRGRPVTMHHGKMGSRHLIGLLGGLVFGFGYGFVVGLVYAVHSKAGLSAGLRLGLADGVVFGLVFGGAIGVTFHLLDLMETPLDIRSAVNPRRLLIVNRRAVTTQLLVGAPVFGVVVGVGGEIVVALLEGPLGPIVWLRAAGLVSGVACALAYVLAVTAWGQWLVLSRIWLPLTGRLPWAVITFLEDAYQRGVLRQAGAVYQFRHARLQHHLAQAHRTLPTPGRTPRQRQRQR
ncbi:MAG: helix-turn-helix domain-containing protein, partial [Streptomyces sp.]|nr:helix-turn-helix domain-containing protein [Streptomyces sp.]